MALAALFTGASGLAANSQALDVIGNNLANLNTNGFKSQRTLFKDLVYQTMNPGTAPGAGTGGINPAQNGFGVGVGRVDSLFTQGAVNPTGRSLDAAIQGSGFFVVSNGSSVAYTRDGSFGVDANGFLIDPNTGDRVQRTGTIGEGSATTPGFQVPGNNNIRVPFGAGVSGTETANVTLQGNLDGGMAVGGTATAGIQVFDSQSTPRAMTLTFTKTGANTYNVTAAVSGGTATVPATPVTFDQNGLLVSPATLAVSVSGIPGAAAQTITLNLGTPGQATGLTQFGATSTASAVTQDGAGSGTLTSISYGQDGQVLGQFSNGRTVSIAQFAIAGFNNEGGLLRQGNNYFTTSASSGAALVGTAGSGGLGSIQGGALEGANVDIATEFSQLIIAQRGFQINAQTITAANEALQVVAGLIR
ncbi:MAG: flgE [Gemmataceae bacterium]|nr:flgE [Gemmataceae bacterium]